MLVQSTIVVATLHSVCHQCCSVRADMLDAHREAKHNLRAAFGSCCSIYCTSRPNEP